MKKSFAELLDDLIDDYFESAQRTGAAGRPSMFDPRDSVISALELKLMAMKEEEDES